MVVSFASRHALRDDDLDALMQEVRIRLCQSQSTSEEISSLPTSYVHQTAMSAAIDLVLVNGICTLAPSARADPGVGRSPLHQPVVAWASGAHRKDARTACERD